MDNLMIATKEKTALKAFSSWAELDEQLKRMDSQGKGHYFELFSKALLITHKQFRAKKVYLSKEIPSSELTRLKITRKDQGQDGLLVEYDGSRVIFQAKYRSKGNLIR